jgi:hypothetical protein
VDERRKRYNTVVWEEIERQIRPSDADILVILDCCFAGDLAKPKKARSQNIFSFLTSTGPGQEAVGPGDDSFTSALVCALHQLSDRPDGFTVMELLSEIQDVPNFQPTLRTQQPQEGWRGDASLSKRLRIKPLPPSHNTVPPPIIPISESVFGSESVQDYLLQLNFSFSSRPTHENISTLVRELAHLINEGHDLPLRNVGWGRLSRRTVGISFREVALEVVRREQNKRRASSVSLPPPTLLKELESSTPTVVIAPGKEWPWAISTCLRVGLRRTLCRPVCTTALFAALCCAFYHRATLLQLGVFVAKKVYNPMRCTFRVFS